MSGRRRNEQLRATVGSWEANNFGGIMLYCFLLCLLLVHLPHSLLSSLSFGTLFINLLVNNHAVHIPTWCYNWLKLSSSSLIN